ncbi:hypothetical protein BK126_03100 [Paenibacillus sp. FSL H7-0326]|uniref:hypothetical protein n=1 Tax=Paenibacillus sp. FSL H7-0326 TaxID=1921144 RepID=UPI00096DA221|nr:hypothetical protein [Paenibacillus sp. FSL H7-0326]OMC71115.1 hypothetical protein BK126_03100 [Paenibacillus sp. FSL H7-0326]
MSEKEKINSIQVVGGQMNFKHLTHKVDAKTYAQSKARMWLGMINDRMQPKKWLKPNSKGTRVNFDTIASDDALKIALAEYEVYLNQINEEFGLDYKLRATTA